MQTIWKGSISFGLLNVPVKLGAATSRESVSFRQLHKACNTPIKQKRFCPNCNAEVAYEDIVRGYEYEPGKFVIITEEELDSLPIRSTKYIDIVDFIHLSEVDPVYYDKTYYLWPDKGGEKPYVILRNAMAETGRAAVAKLTMREKESLCLIRIVSGALSLETMFYPDEVRSTAELGVDALAQTVTVRSEEMKMALKLVENLTAPFSPEKYHDEYREELMKLIRAKLEGQDVVSPPPLPDPGNVVDIMERLRKSVEATEKAKAAEGTARGRGRKKASGG